MRLQFFPLLLLLFFTSCDRTLMIDVQLHGDLPSRI